MSQSFHLFNLQKLDIQIGKAEQRLLEIQKLINQDDRVATTQLVHDQLFTELRQVQQNLKQIEFEVETKRVKLEQSEANLYSGRVKIPKELQDLQNEVSAIKRSLNTLEDQQLDIMLVVEGLTADLENSTVNLEKVKAKVSEDQAGLNGERRQLTNELDRLHIERAAISNQITRENITKYDLLRKNKRGIAVVSLTDNACMACGSTLTPAESQAARSPSIIVLCPSCGRIVYSG
jgi:uncharacterized protein